MTKIIGFAGSLRTGSYNKMALRLALNYAKEAGAEVEIIDLRELNIPLYDKEVELVGFPEGVKFLRKKIESTDGIIIATPEYNHSYSGVLKNAIDWVSRGEDPMEGKKVALIGASDGQFGAARALVGLYPVLLSSLMYIFPYRVQIPNADKKFDNQGNLVDEGTKERLEKLGKGFVAFVEKNS